MAALMNTTGARKRWYSSIETMETDEPSRDFSATQEWCFPRILRLLAVSIVAALGVFSVVAYTFIPRDALMPTSPGSDPNGYSEAGYDFIVVGSGPGGSVVSRRLVDKGFDVLLIEAGGPTQFDVGGGDYFSGPLTRFDIPLFWHAGVGHFPEYTWQGLNLPRVILGKGVGGSAVMDAMIYIRCTPEDMEKWNISGWTWEEVLGAYVALEDFSPDVPGDIPYFHGASTGTGAVTDNSNEGGASGPIKGNPMRRRMSREESDLGEIFRINTERPGYIDDISERFVSAAVYSGIPLSEDFNNPEGGRHGVGYYYFNIRSGVRDSAAVRMLSPLLFKGGRRTGDDGVIDSDQNSYGRYINGKSDIYYGRGVGKFTLLTHSEVVRVIFKGEEDMEDYLTDSLNASLSQNGFGFGFGGIMSAKGSLSGSIGNKVNFDASGKVTAGGGGGGGAKGGGGGGGGVGGGGGGGDAASSDGDGDDWKKYDSGQQRRGLLNDDNQSPEFSGIAIGVEYIQNGILKRAYLKQHSTIVRRKMSTSVAKQEGIVLTAGAIHTPKLLMNSGIGPSEVLENSGAKINVNSPLVGKNLKDHPAVGVVAFADPSIFSAAPSAFELAMNWGQYVEAIIQARTGGSYSAPTTFGIVGTPGISAGAFLKSPFSDGNQPDIQLTVFPKIPAWTGQPMNLESSQRNLVQITVALLDADAKREIILNETDPLYSPPIIKLPGNDTRYLSDLDVTRLVWGIQQARQILSSPPLSLNLTIDEVSPGPSLENNNTMLRTWVEETVYIYSHWVGTAQMGDSLSGNDKEDILNSVVDPNLRVRGTSNLFVADASVMPFIPNGNVHSTVAMVGYRAADLIANATSQK